MQKNQNQKLAQNQYFAKFRPYLQKTYKSHKEYDLRFI